MKINELVKEAYEQAVKSGWHESPRNPLEVHMLIVSEIAEATEAVRNGKPAIYQITKYEDVLKGESTLTVEIEKFIESEKFEGEAIELADAVIRIMDYFGERGWDLEQAIKLKMAYNKTRSYRHNGKKA